MRTYELLRAARCAVDEHWASRWSQGHLPGEIEQTGVLLATCVGEDAHYVEFTAPQESMIGSDWLWWFVEETGECFGMLVQAKRLVREQSGWTVGLDYRTSNGDRQIDLLLAAADALHVPAAYVLYCGSAAYRQDFPCQSDHADGCDKCGRSGVVLLEALVAEYGLRWPEVAQRAFARSMPLEDVAAEPTGRGVLLAGVKSLDPELVRFLMTPQTGARGIAKRLVESVAAVRHGQLGAAVLERVATVSEALFDSVPDDRGHLVRPYLQFILRGLRKEPPPIVNRILNNRSIDQPHPSIAGVVVVAA